MAKKKEENKWLQVGNFLLGVEKKSQMRYVVLKAVSDNWRVYWSEQSLMFAMMLQLMQRAASDDGAKEYLHSLITMMFVTTTYMHDLVALSTKSEMPFCEGIAKLLKEQNDYEESLKEQPTEKDEKEALEEVVRMREVEEELEKLDEDEQKEEKPSDEN